MLFSLLLFKEYINQKSKCLNIQLTTNNINSIVKNQVINNNYWFNNNNDRSIDWNEYGNLNNLKQMNVTQEPITFCITCRRRKKRILFFKQITSQNKKKKKVKRKGVAWIKMPKFRSYLVTIDAVAAAVLHLLSLNSFVVFFFLSLLLFFFY